MNTYGERLKFTIFGESHGFGVGMVLDGIPQGLCLDMEAINEEMARRAPGTSELATQRREADVPVFMSGLFDGVTTGTPITAVIQNSDQHSSAYDPKIPRPSHADLAAWVKFRGMNDYRGGGHFSGRLTAGWVVAGAVCRQELKRRGVVVEAKIVRIGKYEGDGLTMSMKKEILDARAAGDSVGGTVECVCRGVPAGTGGLMFGGLESRLAGLFYAIPGVKGVEFGAGFALAEMRGSQANDPIRVSDGRIYTETNHSGGINGGLSNGMPIVCRLAFRPTPSIGREQKSINLETMENVDFRVRGRHDPCIVPRAVPVAESAMCIAILDAILDAEG
ncbi:MAG: chorismate synthase [Oscillospiraceae bacterium]